MVRTAHHTPRWVAEWTEFETYTDSDGNTQTRLVTRRQTHHPRWWVTSSIGDISINQGEYANLRSHFGDEKKTRGHRPNFHSGDRYDYQLVNVNNFRQPVHSERHWSNRVKAAPSVFSFPQVPEGISVFDYPQVNSVFQSNRLLGTASRNIDILEFDRMAGWLGPAKKVNVIIIGFGEDSDQSIAQYQEAHWIGGKKNDLVLCYGGSNGNKPGWSYVFGWTDEALVKRNLETILLTNQLPTT